MSRLLRYENRTSRLEHGMFLGLGVAGLALVVLTLLDAARFAENRSEIVRSLTRPAETTLAVTTNASGSTNLTSIQKGAPGESPRLNRFPMPKS